MKPEAAAPIDMMSADPAAGADEGAQDTDTGGFTIEIEVDGQGNLTVSLEDANQESAEGSSPEDESQAIPAKSIDDALKIAKEMFLAETGEAGVSPQDAWNQEAANRAPPTATA